MQATAWMDIEGNMLSEKSQSQNFTCVILFIHHSQERQNCKGQMSIFQGLAMVGGRGRAVII